MSLLLDTHVVIWLFEGSPRLSPETRQALDQAARDEGVVVSAVSFLETAVLDARRRISISKPVRRWRGELIADPGVTEAPITGDVAIEAVHLPGRFHRDPADRIIIATARLNGWRLATRDKRILAYGAAGHVKAVRV